ncbi:hypothetical protein Tco_0830244, partial [Tanacetum coccineum]
WREAESKPSRRAAESTRQPSHKILVINFGKSPSEVNQPIENSSEINLLEVDASPVNDDNANANEGNAEDDVYAHDDDDDVVVSDDDEVNPSTNVEEVLSSDDSDDDN